jgi:hypothetical protein
MNNNNNRVDNSDIPVASRLALVKDMLSSNYMRDMSEQDMMLWDKAARESKSVGPDYDYGFSGELDDRGHSSDRGKLPNHPTFSNLSEYSTGGLAEFHPKATGGSWSNDGVFTPSDNQVKRGSINILQWMMDNNRNDGDRYMNPINGKILEKR